MKKVEQMSVQKFSTVANQIIIQPKRRMRWVVWIIGVCVFTSLTPLLHAQQHHTPFLQTLEPYKPIYLLHSWFLDKGGSSQGYLDQEIKIQFSFKKNIIRNLYFAYSQKAFWQLYDKSTSRSFRENNYNPEFFFEFEKLWEIDYWRFGFFEHESNGEKSRLEENRGPVNYSRTWNRTYLFIQKVFFPDVAMGLKVWGIMDRKDSEFGSFYEDNPDIRQYMGNGEFYTDLSFGPSSLSLMMRRGFRNGTETLRIEGQIPISSLFGTQDNGLDLFLQAFSGYGESLLDYNRKLRRVAVGLSVR